MMKEVILSATRILLTFFASFILLVIIAVSTNAESRAEKCTLSVGPAQFFDDMRTCVTSVLQSQGRNRYGPEQFNNEQAAWCEGVPGDGVGEEIRFYFSGAASPFGFSIENGYGKSAKAFRNNGRVAAMRMSDDAGDFVDIYLKDVPESQYFKVPWHADRPKVNWFRFTILKIYPGRKYKDTCIGFIGPDFEGVLINSQQGLSLQD